jgi:hypothetical protein
MEVSGKVVESKHFGERGNLQRILKAMEIHPGVLSKARHPMVVAL